MVAWLKALRMLMDRSWYVRENDNVLADAETTRVQYTEPYKRTARLLRLTRLALIPRTTLAVLPTSANPFPRSKLVVKGQHIIGPGD